VKGIADETITNKFMEVTMDKKLGIKIGICEWVLPLLGTYNCKITSESGLEGIGLGSYEQGFPLTNEIIQKAYLKAGEKWNIMYPSITVNALLGYGMTSHENSEKWVLPLPGPYSCKIAAELGLEGIELDLGSYEQGFPLTNQIVQQAYLEAGEKWNIMYPSIAVNALLAYGMTNPENSKKRDIALGAIYKGIDTAEALKIPIVQLPSFKDGLINNEEDFRLTSQCIKIACQYAEDKGIIIATENILSVEDNLRLLNEVGYNNLKIFFDTLNPYRRKKYDVAEMIRKIGRFICEVHVKDGNDDEMFTALGSGKSDFYKSIEALKEINFSGWIYLENFYNLIMLNYGSKESFELLKLDINILKKVLNK
jgi:sugar phosphate isomerase/epimerase